MTVGEWIRRERNNRGIKQRDMAKQLHMSTDQLSRIENNARPVGEKLMAELEAIFGKCTADQIWKAKTKAECGAENIGSNAKPCEMSDAKIMREWCKGIDCRMCVCIGSCQYGNEMVKRGLIEGAIVKHRTRLLDPEAMMTDDEKAARRARLDRENAKKQRSRERIRMKKKQQDEQETKTRISEGTREVWLRTEMLITGMTRKEIEDQAIDEHIERMRKTLKDAMENDR